MSVSTSKKLSCLIGRFFFLAIFLSFSLALLGCQSSLLRKIQPNEFSEQLYIDAKLNFAIKHPLNWTREIIPVSSPKHRDDSVSWIVGALDNQNNDIGHMLIKRFPSNNKKELPDILSNFLADKSELKSGQTEEFDHPAGAALKFVGHNTNRGILMIALRGKQQNFIISLDYPSIRFAELLPIFQDIVSSFSEINKPTDTTSQ